MTAASKDLQTRVGYCDTTARRRQCITTGRERVTVNKQATKIPRQLEKDPRG